jgi:hypothetical protein
LLALLGVALAAAVASAQTPYVATYDDTRSIRLEGPVTRIEWVNPRAFLFIDVKDASDMPVIADPFFQGLSARIRFTPVMNAQDFQTGMAKLAAR